MKCPRCGREHAESDGVLCGACREALRSEARAQGASIETTLKVRMSPILREALASAQPGEDFDEALLRALKARHPEQATALLSGVTRMIEVEAQRENLDRQQAIKRLAESDPGPEIVLKTSGGEGSRTVTESQVFRVGDKEYHSLDEMPPDIRRMVERGMERGPAGPAVPRRAVRKSGCLSMLLGGWLWGLLRMIGK
ncbi:MAG: hypothetical protein JSV65_07715 [Armatimonadota bacterium]|nr:MAG: hypothetical protein JSV65_07715 [Armatimonadota bacterium]